MGQRGYFQKPGTVMEKVQVIAAAPANAVDVFAKVNNLFVFLRILLTLMTVVGSSICGDSVESPEISPQCRQYSFVYTLLVSPDGSHLVSAYGIYKVALFCRGT